MRYSHLAVVALVASKVAAGCHSPPEARPPEPADRRDERARLIAGMWRYDALVRAMDGPAIAAMFVADGVIANAGQVIATGRPQIEKFLGSFAGKVRVEATASMVEHSRIEGDRGFIDGHYAQDARLLADDKRIHVSGRFTGEWLRDADGTWRIRRLETTPDARDAPDAGDARDAAN